MVEVEGSEPRPDVVRRECAGGADDLLVQGEVRQKMHALTTLTHHQGIQQEIPVQMTKMVFKGYCISLWVKFIASGSSKLCNETN